MKSLDVTPGTWSAGWTVPRAPDAEAAGDGQTDVVATPPEPWPAAGPESATRPAGH